MSVKEVSRLQVMEAVSSRRMKQCEAGRVLCLTTRQVRRLQVLYLEQGAAGLISRRRGKRSNNRLDDALKEKAVTLVANRYVGFGPTLAHEKLALEHDLHLSLESLRQLMIDKEGALNLNFDDDLVKGACITHKGEVVNERVRDSVK